MILIPFDRREGISLKEAAKLAGKSVGTIRNWCVERSIGRKVGGGTWIVSKVALSMFLDGDDVALAAYLSGDRESEIVAPYFARFNLMPQTCQRPQSSQKTQ
jgi:hypothetical protein